VPLVFLIVLATGYFEIMRRLWRQPNLDGDIGINVVQQESFEDSEHLLSDVKSWEEIGAEFRMMLYDIIHRFREEIKNGR